MSPWVPGRRSSAAVATGRAVVAMVALVTADGPLPQAAPVTGLSHVQLLVSDLRASVDWYTVALGLEPQAGEVGAGYVALRHRRARLVIVLTAAPARDASPSGTADSTGVPATGAPAVGASAVGASAAERHGSLDHLAFAVPDGNAVYAWADHLSAMGVGHDGVVLENGNPSLRLRDPDGNAIELVAPASSGSGRSAPATLDRHRAG
ncbi:MAG: VOC family protein [Acidimicrobiales bacterium]